MFAITLPFTHQGRDYRAVFDYQNNKFYLNAECYTIDSYPYKLPIPSEGGSMFVCCNEIGIWLEENGQRRRRKIAWGLFIEALLHTVLAVLALMLIASVVWDDFAQFIAMAPVLAVCAFPFQKLPLKRPVKIAVGVAAFVIAITICVLIAFAIV